MTTYSNKCFLCHAYVRNCVDTSRYVYGCTDHLRLLYMPEWRKADSGMRDSSPNTRQDSEPFHLAGVKSVILMISEIELRGRVDCFERPERGLGCSVLLFLGLNRMKRPFPSVCVSPTERRQYQKPMKNESSDVGVPKLQRLKSHFSGLRLASGWKNNAHQVYRSLNYDDGTKKNMLFHAFLSGLRHFSKVEEVFCAWLVAEKHEMCLRKMHRHSNTGYGMPR